MIPVKCIQRQYNQNGVIVGYVIQDQQGNIDTIYPDIVKQELKQRDSVLQPALLDFVNLKLTKDNRIFLIKDKKPSSYCYIESYTIHTYEKTISNISNKTLIFRSKTVPKMHLAKYKLMNISVERYKFYEDYLYLETQQTVEFVSAKQIRFRNSNLRDNMGVKAEGFFSNLHFKAIDISQVDTVEMSDMRAMFANCRTLSVNLSTINTTNVITMESMFDNFGRDDTVLDLSHFNTSKVKDFSFMFAYYRGKANIDITMFNIKPEAEVYGMFIFCQAENVNIKGLGITDIKNEDKGMFVHYKNNIIQ